MKKYLFFILFVFALGANTLAQAPSTKPAPKTPVAKNETGYFVDERDGQKYKWVKIGEQVWMAQNLNYNVGKGSYYYDNKAENGKRFGMMYSWEIAPKAVPDGWHIPTDAEWKQLEIALGMTQAEADKEGPRGKDEGKKLRIGGGSGFDILMGGYRGADGLFANVTKGAYFWTATESDKSNAVLRCIYFDSPKIIRNAKAYKLYADYIRCVKD
jgi:uncharacterized protein (TIGR02145 family)